MDKIIDILPKEEQHRERILHAVKRVAEARKALDKALDELALEFAEWP